MSDLMASMATERLPVDLRQCARIMAEGDSQFITAIAVMNESADEIEALRAQLTQARSDALEEAASLADDLSDEPSVDQTNPGDIAIHEGWSASRSIARSIRALKGATQVENGESE